MATSQINSYLRLSGMASGLDTESMIQSLMKVENLKLYKLERQKTKLQWQKDAKLEINNKLRAFREKYMSVLSPSTNMYTESAYKMYKVSMETETSAVSINAGTKAIADDYVINEITSIAKGANTSSTVKVSGGKGLNLSAELRELALTTPLNFDENDEISFSINDEVFTFKSTDSLQTLINKINNSKAGVTISYSSLSDQFTIKTKETGANRTLKIENISGNAFGESGSAFGIVTGTYQNGENAKLKINGFDVERESNSFTIDGITYNLKGLSKTEIKFNVSQDIDSVVNKVKSFIEEYNKIIEDLNAKIKEKKYYDYYPLVDEEIDEMTEKEVELWNEKAKSGILRNDKNITSFLAELRSMIYEKVDGVGKSLADIGIKTGIYSDRGKLTLDEDTFRKALANNPDEVTQIFTKTSTATDNKQKYKESGIMSKISISIGNYIGAVDLSKIDEDIGDLDDKIDEMELYLYEVENKYWAKFSQMETALSKMYSQQNWLSQLSFGS